MQTPNKTVTDEGKSPRVNPTAEIIIQGGVAIVDYVPKGFSIRITDNDSIPAEVDTYEG